MASAFAWSESYSTGPTKADTTFINLYSSNSVASGSDATTVPAANTILIPAAGSSYSYEKWIQGHWTGTFTTITAVYFWKSAGTPGTGCTLNAGDVGSQTYSTAVATASSVATAGIPTAQGTGLTLGYATAFSDYIVLQLVVGTTAVQGAGATMTYSMQWNET